MNTYTLTEIRKDGSPTSTTFSGYHAETAADAAFRASQASRHTVVAILFDGPDSIRSSFRLIKDAAE